jgi:hypothetical protein
MKSFCGCFTGQFFQKAPPLAAGGNSDGEFLFINPLENFFFLIIIPPGG